MGFLALTSPRLEWKDKVIWLIPSLTVGFAYLARSESDSLQRQVGELKNKLYRSPTA
jgi:transposase